MLLLFSNAPFIDDIQPYIISRTTRKSWCFGQILYIVVGSAIYVIVSVIMSVLMIAGNMELTTGWGKVITTAGKVKDIAGAGSTGVSGDILYYFSPFIAMFYTMLLVWLACVFIGLLIYVINSVSGKTGYGIFVGGFLLIFDYVQQIMASDQREWEWLSYLSPISWCSINLIDITGKRQLPDIYFVFGGYIIMILILA